MPDEMITLDDVPASQIPFARIAIYGPMRDDMAHALARIAQLAPGRALKITHAPIHMASNLWSACRWRWPGTEVRQHRGVIVVIPPQDSGAL